MIKMDKSHGGIYKKGEEPDDLLYWLSRPPVERLRALEDIRREYNTWKYGSEPRLQRVYRVIKTKLATGRPQDKADAAKLIKKKGK